MTKQLSKATGMCTQNTGDYIVNANEYVDGDDENDDIDEMYDYDA